ncbi:MAG: RAMP superfamily CRISPR-associated protein [Mariniphaga sp.]
MQEGRIILKGTITNDCPIGIGSGKDAHSDRDVVLTLYPMASANTILEAWPDEEASFMKAMPFIPATSFLGKVNSMLLKNSQMIEYWGQSEENASFIDCSDVMITKLPDYVNDDCSNLTEVRDGIRMNSLSGTVSEGAKFDYELLGAGADFCMTIIFRIENNYDIAMEIASAIVKLIKDGIDIGSKSTVGYGRLKGSATLFGLDFSNPQDFTNWIDGSYSKPDYVINMITPVATTLLADEANIFEIKGSFRIKNSLIIRSYSTNPEAPDSAHLKSGGRNIISGSSIKGALRGRAERILNVIHADETITEALIASLFGDVEKDPNDKQKVRPDGYTVPSRVFVNEIPVENVREDVQTRIQIDRFTGGTVDSALIEEVPLFPMQNKSRQIENLRISIKNAQPEEKGLMLLLLKDLWTADLPVGGEKAIGRGVLEGISSIITDGKTCYSISEEPHGLEKLTELQKYVADLTNLTNFDFHTERIENYKNKKK